jgi:MscS family membrane protein
MDRLLDFFKAYDISLSQVVTVAIILLMTIVVDFLIRYFFRRYEKSTHHSQTVKTIVYASLNNPLRLVTFSIGFYFIAMNVLTWFKFASFFTSIVTPGVKLGVALAFFIFMNTFASRLKRYLIAKQTRTDGGYNNFAKVEQMEKLAQVLTVVIMVFVVATIFGLQVGQGVAYLGGGLAITGLVFKDTLANIFGGLIIYLDSPYAVGDWIYTVDGNIQGTVEKISWRLTHIRTFDKRLIFTPNNLLVTQAVVNASRMTNRRIRQYIGLRYDDFDKFEAIQKDIYSYLGEHSDIDQNCITLVNVVNGQTDMGPTTEGFFGGSSINFQVYTFTKVTNWARFQAIQDKIMMEIGRIVFSHGAEIAFTTMTLDIPEKDGVPASQGAQHGGDVD